MGGDLVLGEDFFDAHILRRHGEGWFRSANEKLPLIVEKEGQELKLVSGPGYHPSFKKGLYRARIIKSAFGVNEVRKIDEINV